MDAPQKDAANNSRLSQIGKAKIQEMTSTSNVLSFENPVLLVGGGAYDPALAVRYAAAGYVLIAADGGANALDRHGLQPRAIIGDMDSLKDRAQWETRAKVIEIAEQATTDFEKCLYATSAPFYLALGFTGHQFGHTLSALHVLARYGASKNVVMVDSVDVIFATAEPFEMTMEPGERLSIYPLGPVTFERSEGLKYPLDGLHMEQGHQIGTSNEAMAHKIAITPVPGNTQPYAIIAPLTQLDSLLAAILDQEFKLTSS
jgi:thiamine pyrophosphokinase